MPRVTRLAAPLLSALVLTAISASAQQPAAAPLPGGAASAPTVGQPGSRFYTGRRHALRRAEGSGSPRGFPRPSCRPRVLPQGADQRLNGPNGGVP